MYSTITAAQTDFFLYEPKKSSVTQSKKENDIGKIFGVLTTQDEENRFKYWQRECKEANALSCTTQEMRGNVAQHLARSIGQNIQFICKENETWEVLVDLVCL